MTSKVLLVGWDAADWKVIHPLIESGGMQCLARFLEEGVMADMITLDPVLSPMLWNCIATGKRADEHGILGFTEIDRHSGHVRPVSSTSRKVKALWNILSQNGLRTNVIHWFGGHPAEPIRGVCVSDALARGAPEAGQPWTPLMRATVYPERLASVMEELRVRPDEMDSELIRLFVPRVNEIPEDKRGPLHTLVKVQSECLTVHAAATYVMQHEPWDFMAVYYPSIDHFSHAFMHYHPPKPEWVDQELFDFYHDIVNSGYRLHDLMLARLLQLAGDNTTVILLSDHGFHSDHLRPRHIPNIPCGPAVQHRRLGIFCMKGPGIRRDERIYSVNLLDVAPTVLAVFGLPAGQDMPGRVLLEAFEETPSLDRIPTWEEMPGESGMHPADFEMPPEDAYLLLRQFVALGYVDEPKEDLQAAREDCEREQDWNLAQVYMASWRFHEALPVLEKLHDAVPERGDFALALARCQQQVGLLKEASATVAAAIADHRDTPEAHFILSGVEFERRNYNDSLSHLQQAEKANPAMPDLHVRIGFTWLKLRKWKRAERAFGRALEIDPHSPLAYQGLALVYLRQRRWQQAADHALKSVGYQHDLPLSHFWLGVALTRLELKDRAIQAFETALSFHPPLPAAHRWLAMLFSDIPGREEDAQRHRAAMRRIALNRRKGLRKLEEVQQQARHRAIDRAEARAQSRNGEGISEKPESEQPGAQETPRCQFTIVSGLPRSGTSLMMRMLDAAGVPVMTDRHRKADDDNPDGYFEWEAIKQLGRKPEILREAEGKAIKVVSMLVPALPRMHQYKVIFMDRPVEEVVKSQFKMIGNRGEHTPALDQDRMMAMLSAHRQAALALLERAKPFELLVVNYPDLVENPSAWVEKIAAFLGPEQVKHPEKMASVVRPELRRHVAAQFA